MLKLSWILILALAMAAAVAFAAPPAGDGPWEELRAEEGLRLRGGTSHVVLGPYLAETSGRMEGLLLEQGRPVARGAREAAALIAANPEAAARLRSIAARAAAALAEDLGREPAARSPEEVAVLRLLVLAAEVERAGASRA